MPSTEIERGEPGRTVARNVQAIRKRRNLGQQQLSARLAELGRPIPPTALSKLEDGKRRVDVDDLVALAIALNVSPSRLLLPERYDDQSFELTPTTTAPSWLAWSWAEGDGPLAAEPSEDEQEDYDRERPVGRRRLSQHPAMRSAEQIRFGILRLLDHLRKPEGRDEQIRRYLQYTRREIQVLSSELDRIKEEWDDRG